MKAKLAKCYHTLVKSLGNNILFFKDNDKLLTQLAFFLSDACQEVRATAKAGFQTLAQEVMSKSDLERLLQRVLNENNYKKVKDFLDREAIMSTGSQQEFVIATHYGGSQGKKLKLKSGQLRGASLKPGRAEQDMSGMSVQGQQS